MTAVRVFTDRRTDGQKDRRTDGTENITSTAYAGGKNLVHLGQIKFPDLPRLFRRKYFSLTFPDFL